MPSPSISSPSLETFRRGVRAFYARALARPSEANEGGGIAAVHRLLIDAAMTDVGTGPPRRRASLCLDDTPIVYSFAVPPLGRATPSLRLLVEPGGTRCTVARQIDAALAVADQAIDVLGWQGATADLNGIIRRAFPPTADEVRNWWGGIWLGLAASPEGTQLRLYLNLRFGGAQARWQRVADILGFLADARLGDPLIAFVAQVSPLAIPVGLGVVLAGGRIAALRLYVGIHAPSRDTLRGLMPAPTPRAEQEVATICQAFVGLPQCFRPQAVTAAYDFYMAPDGIMEPEIGRAKFDVSCQFASPDDQPALRATLTGLADRWGLDAGAMNGFLDALVECFGPSPIEYVSMAPAPHPVGLAVYVKPGGYAGG